MMIVMNIETFLGIPSEKEKVKLRRMEYWNIWKKYPNDNKVYSDLRRTVLYKINVGFENLNVFTSEI